MASIRERAGRFVAEVCINGRRQSRSFDHKDAAEAWASVKEGKVTISPSIGKSVSSQFVTEEEIVANALPFVRIGGIYFLVQGVRIVYVGRSSHLMRRVAQHANNGVEFDSYFFMLCEESRAAVLEPYYIKKFDPTLNKTFSSNRFNL